MFLGKNCSERNCTFIVYVRKEKAMHPSAGCNSKAKKRKNPCCALPGSIRVARSAQEGGTTLCIHFLHAWQKSKGQCVYSIFSSSVTQGREFCIDFCPKVHKSQQAPTQPFSALGAFQQYGANLEKISGCLVISLFHLALHENTITIILFSQASIFTQFMNMSPLRYVLLGQVCLKTAKRFESSTGQIYEQAFLETHTHCDNKFR